MNDKANTAREALIAELLGDAQQLLSRFELADKTAKETTDALRVATEQYRQQIDELVNRLRSETASIILKTTEHAAHSLVGQQQETLQKAATQAIHMALNEQLLKRSRRDWFMSAAVGAGTGAAVALLAMATRSFFA